MDFTPKRKENGPMHSAKAPVIHRQDGQKAGRIVATVGGVLVVAALVAGAWLFMNGRSGAAAIDKDAYQAVFLTNGQVYFGDLESAGDDYLTMKNIYYLQVQQDLQPGEGNQKPSDKNQNNVQLVKLGNELHGPQDEMQISSKQVLFWENLKNDGKVAKAMKEYKAE